MGHNIIGNDTERHTQMDTAQKVATQRDITQWDIIRDMTQDIIQKNTAQWVTSQLVAR